MKSTVYLNSITSKNKDIIADFILNGLNKIGEEFPGVSGDKLLLKPNFVTGIKGMELACTSREMLEAVFTIAKDKNLKIFLGDSPGFGSVKGICKTLKIIDIVDHYGVKILEFKRGLRMHVAVNGRNIPFVTISDELKDFEHIINLPKAKSHLQMTYTGAVKNHFGFICGKNKPVIHCRVDNNKVTFGKLLINLCKLIKCDLHIMDGIEAMDGNGGIRGDKYNLNKILISKDPLALDHVFSIIINVPDKENHLLIAAEELGETAAFLQNIEIVGELLDKARVHDFSFPKFRNISFNPMHLVKSVSKSIVYKAMGK